MANSKRNAPVAGRTKVATKRSTRSVSRTKPRARNSADAARLPRSAARTALDQATGAIRRLQKDSARNHWAIGRRLAQVAELKLHEARGFTTLEAYADKQLGLARASAFQYMRVATAFSEEVAATFGPEKLDRALRYIARTPEDEKPSDIPELRIAVPQDGGAVAHKPFAEVTVAELRRATQAATGVGGKKKRTKSKLPEAAAEALAKANKALDAAVGRRAAAGAVVSAKLAGEQVLLEVRGVPLDRAAAAFRAIAAALGQRR